MRVERCHHLHLLLITVSLACLSTGCGDSRYEQMRSRMAAIDSLNRHYQPFSIDSVSEMADYFDSHGTPHDRIMAYYLLGSAFRDAGEAPAALKVEDSAAGADQPTYYGAFHFNDGADSDLEYAYDWNGNMTRDMNKGITEIKYNCLNLPSRITFSDGSTAVYTYSATGEKLGVRHVTASSNVYEAYCDNFIYRAGSLKRVLVDGGYITLSGGTKYHYYLKDHLGNNRMVVRADGTVEQVTHYYPYGGLMGESTGGDTQPYKYNGKELDRTNGLDLYDYGARHMDAALGRFTTMDPLCEKYYSISPYAYCAGNPINYIDPDGDSIYVADKYREQFLKDLSKTFGNRIVKDFSFSSSGNLVYIGSTKDMNDNQLALFNGMNKLMGEEMITKIYYKNEYLLETGNSVKLVNTNDYGGAFSVTGGDKNAIVINPNQKQLKVFPVFNENESGINQLESIFGKWIKTNTSDMLFHEIGHLLYEDTGSVIDYNNKAR